MKWVWPGRDSSVRHSVNRVDLTLRGFLRYWWMPGKPGMEFGFEIYPCIFCFNSADFTAIWELAEGENHDNEEKRSSGKLNCHDSVMRNYRWKEEELEHKRMNYGIIFCSLMQAAVKSLIWDDGVDWGVNKSQNIEN